MQIAWWQHSWMLVNPQLCCLHHDIKVKAVWFHIGECYFRDQQPKIGVLKVFVLFEWSLTFPWDFPVKGKPAALSLNMFLYVHVILSFWNGKHRSKQTRPGLSWTRWVACERESREDGLYLLCVFYMDAEWHMIMWSCCSQQPTRLHCSGYFQDVNRC